MKSFSKQDGIIWDPFCGEGAIEVAAKKLNRRFLGFEIVPERAEKARKHVDETISVNREIVYPKMKQEKFELTL